MENNFPKIRQKTKPKMKKIRFVSEKTLAKKNIFFPLMSIESK